MEFRSGHLNVFLLRSIEDFPLYSLRTLKSDYLRSERDANRNTEVDIPKNILGDLERLREIYRLVQRNNSSQPSDEVAE